MNAPKFSAGDWVVYVPGHAEGNVLHPDCERGTVTSVGETSGLVFVRYGAQPNAKATSPSDLVDASQYFAAVRDAMGSPSARQPPRSGYRAYLGDGLFADFDGFNVVLSAENGMFSHDTVYLESAVVEGFRRWYVTRIAPLYKSAAG